MTRPTISHFLTERQANNLANFTNELLQHHFWHVLPEGEDHASKSLGLFNPHQQVLIPGSALKAMGEFLNRHDFVDVFKKNQHLAILHSPTKLLWSNAVSGEDYSLGDARSFLQKTPLGDLSGWQLPTKAMLEKFAKGKNNPCQVGQAYRLKTSSGGAASYWLTSTGCCDVDNGVWTITDKPGRIFAYNPYWGDDSSEACILLELAQRGWQLRSSDGGVPFSAPSEETSWQSPTIEALLADWVKRRAYLRADGENPTELNPRDFWLPDQLAQLDYIPCRLPQFDNAQLTDPDKGLWELWGEDPTMLKTLGLAARDPGRDIQRRAVAIDFGTSSTVVAMDNEHGARELLRIGVRNFFQPVKAQDFENPTVLECVDFPAFAQAWAATAYRPALNWDWMRAAHEARENFRSNPGDIRILSSILPLLKQWALRTTEQRKRLTDQQTPGHEMELEPHVERNPVRGQPLMASPNDAFDPIELYAWYLGMAINWRGRGLFLKYYLSFPVKYPSEVKQRTLASFRRGLQRSLPQTLIDHHLQLLSEFEVNELATEPAAYAASALPHLRVEPTDEGVPYAVFDFGGGTSDFDYGLLRWATPDEEELGYERVFEHLASSGDNFLGGENLLEHLVYESFKQNLPELREKRIQFTLPIDAQRFAGSEAFLSTTQAAQTNAIMLADKLRVFLESDAAQLAVPTVSLNLIDVDGHKQTCELVLDAEVLDALLGTRIRRGVNAFLAELARLRPKLPVNTPIQVLLAGNGSRSRHVKAMFDTAGEQWKELLAEAFGETQTPEIVVHAPLPMDDAAPHAPTAKTGVALGLLRLVPGENTLLKNQLHAANDGEAPFSWYVGRMRRGGFEHCLAPHATYGRWKELGPLQQGVFNLYTTNSPRAHSLREGDGELRKHRLDFPAAPEGARLYARATKPNVLELATAVDLASLESAETNFRYFALN